MQNISVLHEKFANLPVSSDNYSLWGSLLSIDQAVFKPIMEQILAGKLTIEDFRPFISKFIDYLRYDSSIARQTERFLTEDVDDAELIKTRMSELLFGSDQTVMEVTLERTTEVDILDDIRTDMNATLGLNLSREDVAAMATGIAQTEKISTLVGNTSIQPTDLSLGDTEAEILKAKQLLIADSLTRKE